MSMCDLVEVVRCKDCAKSYEKDVFGLRSVLECSRTDLVVQPDGFCAWGERRNEP